MIRINTIILLNSHMAQTVHKIWFLYVYQVVHLMIHLLFERKKIFYFWSEKKFLLQCRKKREKKNISKWKDFWCFVIMRYVGKYYRVQTFISCMLYIKHLNSFIKMKYILVRHNCKIFSVALLCECDCNCSFRLFWPLTMFKIVFLRLFHNCFLFRLFMWIMCTTCKYVMICHDCIW